MPPEYSYPGVYVEEVPDSIHPIAGVPTHTSGRLKRIAAHFRKCGQGTRLLFAGPGKDTKLSAARALAGKLQLRLYRVDLSAVVDKYIGETEKNLGRVFDAAGEAGAILLFDEADVLFGKRSGVKDSHDRYANLKVDYLLQRIEAFEGLVILAANRKKHLARAYFRRLQTTFSLSFRNAGRRARSRPPRSAAPRAG